MLLWMETEVFLGFEFNTPINKLLSGPLAHYVVKNVSTFREKGK